MDPLGLGRDRRAAARAARQHGVVTLRHLLEAGLTRDQVKSRVRRGLLHRVYREVYRVGHMAPSTEADYTAAVLACGEGARLGGHAAAFHYGIERGVPPPPEVTTMSDRRVAGIKVRRVGALHPLDVTEYRGLPTLTVPAVLVELAAHLSLDDLARANHHAEVLHGVRVAAVAASLARRPGATGSANLRRVIEGDAAVVLSALEKRFPALLRGEGLPLPLMNRRPGAHYVDCRWPGHRLTVELDSYRFHHSRHAWEQDRRREREARARGDEFRRFTYRDVFEEPVPMLAELGRLMAASGT